MDKFAAFIMAIREKMYHRSVLFSTRLNSFGTYRSISKSAAIEGEKLTKEQQEQLKSELLKLRIGKPKPSNAPQTQVAELDSNDEDSQTCYLDSIKARGFMKHRYNYNPPEDLKKIIYDTIGHFSAGIIAAGDLSKFDFSEDLSLKFKLLNLLGTKLKHTLTNSELHRIKSVEQLVEFYNRPVRNITEYASMARDESLPKNLHVIENPVRFHPEDVDSYHGGVTAYPGRGGEVFGLRNQRIYRQFQPKKEWFEYEDQTFNYEPPHASMPWDPEVAEKMDKYPNLKYSLKKKGFRRVRNLRS